LKSASENERILFAVMTYFFLFTQALQLNSLINKNRMMQRLNFLPATAYLVITSLMPEWNHFSAPLLVNTLVLLIFSGLFAISNQYSIKSSMYNIGVAVGIGSFIFFPSLILFFWLIFALLVMRSVRLNEWLICLLGVTTPYYFYAAYLFFSDKWSWQQLFQPVNVALPTPGQSLWLAMGTILLVVPFLIGGYFVQENLRKMLIQVRKNWSLMLIYLLFALFIPFLNNSAEGFENWILIIVPFAAFHACTYLYPPQRWIPVVIFWLSITFILVFQYAGPGWHENLDLRVQILDMAKFVDRLFKIVNLESEI
ncbi:MAG TPA: DUF6427 family protein, partial [Chitinophagaceae bacterium]|nr:DUF6427 family protein [Chitinophagaceae bacterium]